MEVTYRRLPDIQLPAFETALRRSCLFASPKATVDAFTSQLVEIVTADLESVAPLKTSLRRQSKPITKWLAKEAAAAKRERRRLEKNWKVNGYETDYIAFRRCCRATTKIINESRRNYHRQKLSNCCDARSRWKAVKELI